MRGDDLRPVGGDELKGVSQKIKPINADASLGCECGC